MTTNPTAPGLLGRIRNAIGQLYAVFPLIGGKGLIIRQPSGVPGTNELQISYSGTDATYNNPQGLTSFTAHNFKGHVTATGSMSFVNALLANFGSTVGVANCLFTFQSGYATETGWVQNTAGRSRVSADVPNATAAMSAITGISHTLIAGRKYTGRLVLKVNNTTATEGIQFDFNGGGATMTSFWAAASEPVGGTTVAGTQISTTLGGVIGWSTITGETIIKIDFSLVCNAAGTLVPRFSEVSHSTGTATVELGSFCWIEDTP